MAEIAARLLDVRKGKGLTQKDMADLLGIPYRTLQDQERGLVQPSASTLTAYSQIGVDLNWLVVGNEFKSKEPVTLNIQPFSAPNLSVEENQSTLIIGRNVIYGSNGGKAKSENLVWSKQADNALKPTIGKGAVLIIDTAAAGPRVGTGIYFLETAAGYVARHVTQTENGFLVVSTDDDQSRPLVCPVVDYQSLNSVGRIISAIAAVK